MNSIVVGLDIGTTKICVVVGQYNEYGRVNILGIGRAESDGVRRGYIENIDRTALAIKKAVAEAERHANVDIRVVNVGIAGEHIHSLQQKGIITLNHREHVITAADVERLQDDMYRISIPAGSDIIHVLPQEYFVDGEFASDPVGMSGVRLEGNFHIVTAQSAAARNIVRCVHKAGLTLDTLVLQPIASSYACLSADELEAGVCLVDIGGGTTDVSIYIDNVVRHTAVIPFGGNVVTDDITKGIVVMKKNAEFLKTNYGSAMASELPNDEIISIAGMRDRPNKEIRRRTLASVIQARMEEIFEFVAREIKVSGCQDRLVGGIVVTGGGGKLRDIHHLASYVTGLDARIGLPTEHTAYGMVQEVQDPSFSTAVGLVCYGLKHESDQRRRSYAVLDPQPAQQPTQPELPETVGEPKPGFISNLRNWFESSLSNSNNLE